MPEHENPFTGLSGEIFGFFFENRNGLNLAELGEKKYVSNVGEWENSVQKYNILKRALSILKSHKFIRKLKNDRYVPTGEGIDQYIFWEKKIDRIKEKNREKTAETIAKFKDKDGNEHTYEIDLSGLDEEDLKLSNKVMALLLSRDKDEATEELVKDILGRYRIYTIRSDNTREMWIYIDGIYVPKGESYIKERCRLILGDAYTTHLGGRIVAKIEADTFIDAEKFFAVNDPYETAVKNGILNLRTGEKADFTPDKIFFNKINARYDPEVTFEALEESDNPGEARIPEFIREVVKESDIPIVQELFGFVLVREYFSAKAFMLLGGGSNGKSVFLDLVKRFVGEENCASISFHTLIKKDFAVCGLHNRLVNLAGDISSKTLYNTDIFKALTGKDLISADRKYKDMVHFENYAKIINSCNELPKTSDFTPGFFRRWKIIDFPNTFVPEKEYEQMPEEEKKKVSLADPDIIEKIATEDELSALLNWAIEGLHRILEDGFSDSQTTEDKKIEWLRKSNSFEAFCMDCVRETNIDDFVTKDDLRGAYMKYCRDNRLKPQNDKVIREVLIERYGAFDTQKTFGDGKERVWCGIALARD